MSTPFDGTWVGERNVPVEVSSAGEFVTLKYSDGGGPFTGFTGLLGRPVITVMGNPPQAGVLAEDGSRVVWSNNTVWNRTT